MKTLSHEELKFANDHDEAVVFQDNSDKKYIAIGGTGKDINGNYRDSAWHDTKEEALQCLGVWNGFIEETLKENLPNWAFIDSIPPKLATVAEGTKVKVLDCAREECERIRLRWYEEKEEMVGKVCEIEEINGSDYYIWNEDKSDYWVFPRSAFTVVLEEEVSSNEILITKEMVGRRVRIIN